MSVFFVVLAIAVAWLVVGLVIAFLLGAAIARNERASRAHVPAPRRPIDGGLPGNGPARSTNGSGTGEHRHPEL